MNKQYWLSFAALLLNFGLATATVEKRANAATSPAVVTLGKPVQLDSTNPSFQSIAMGSDAFQGKLVYALRMTEVPYQNYLVLVDENKTSRQGKTALAVSRTVEGINNETDVVFSPQFSPDGRFILFKIGWPYDRHGLHQIFIWDLLNNQVKELPLRYSNRPLLLSYPITLWSPDSNYIAYIRGGDLTGNVEPDAFLFLDIYNWRTGETRFVVKNNAVRFGFAWSKPNTLLYSVLSPTKGQEAARVDIYGISAQGGMPRLVVKNGYRPIPSVDGQRIAFFGPENPKEVAPLGEGWEYNPRGMALSVINADGTNRKAINRENINYPQVVWLSDGKQLLSVKAIVESDNGGKGSRNTIDKEVYSRAQISRWVIATGERASAGELTARDFEPIPRAYIQPQFRAMGLSSDEKSLVVLVSEMIGVNMKSSRYVEQVSLKISDLQSEEVTTVAKIRTSLGIDAHMGLSRQNIQ